MCDSSHDPWAAHASPAFVPADLGAFTGQRIPLKTVERVTITSLVDNAIDGLAEDKGPAHRPSAGHMPRFAASTLDGGYVVDAPHAEHGFSALVEIELAGGPIHCVLFDTGVSPDGMVENMRRLDLDP